MRRSAVTLLLGLAGCIYQFDNPAEELRTGEASGRVVADRLGDGALAGFPGVSVSLKGSALDQVTRETGRFALLGLPPGRHTLLFRKGTTWALEREVELGFGSDGQPEGVDLRDVVLRYAAAVEGTVTLLPGNAIASGLAVDEVTGQTAVVVPDLLAPHAGRFRFPVLDVGVHRVKVAVNDALAGAWVAGPAVVTLGEADQGTTLALSPLAARAAALTGRLRFRVQLVGDPGFATGDVQAFLAPDPLGLNPVPADSQGFVDVTVPEGLYAVSLVAPPSPRVVQARPAPAPTLPTPTAYGVVLDGRVAEVGSVYVVPDALALQASLTCAAPADCGAGSCVDRLCVGYEPATAAGAGVPFCAPCDPSPTGQLACDAGTGKVGICVSPGACDPGCGAVCTPDGVTTLGLLPGSGC